MGVTRIQHNLSAMNAMSNYQGNQNTLTGNLEKLSSGYRINSAADDAAGLAISEKMRSQIAGLEKAQDNANDGISLIQTAEGALTEVNSMLTRLKTLATQSANGTYDDGVDRANLQEETDALLSEIDRISQSTNFNGINLLDGSMSNAGIKQTTAGVNINGIAMSAMKSEDGVATQFKVALSNTEGAKEGDNQTFKFNYTDEQGAEKSASITFEIGSDKAGSSKNLAEAINKNADLGKHFTASVNDDNDLIMTSNIKAAAATGSDITTGAAKVANVENVSDNISVNIDKQTAVADYQKLSDKLYSEDGTELKNSRQIERAFESGQKLYTDIASDGNAKVVSNDVTNSELILTAEARNLTSDTTFTLTKSASLDPTKTSAALQNVTLTDEGKAIQNDTMFTFTSATATASAGNATLTNKASGMTSDVTFTYTSAKLGAVSDGLKVTDTQIQAGTSAAALTTNMTLTYTEAKVSSNGTSGVNKDDIVLTDMAKALVDETTFKFNEATKKDAGCSASLGGVTLQAAGRQLMDLSATATSATEITFTYQKADVTNSDTFVVGGVNGDKNNITLTSAARSLTDDYTFEFDKSSTQWKMYRSSYENLDAAGNNASVVDISKYVGYSDVDLTKTTSDALKDGDKITITAGYWQLTSTGNVGLEKNASDSAGNDIISVGDGSKYFNYEKKDALNGVLEGNETITIKSGSWTATGQVTGEQSATSAAQYFSGGSPQSSATVKIDGGYWTSSNTSLGAKGNGTLTSTEAVNFFGNANNVKNTGANKTGQSVEIVAKHWQANDTSLGDNGNVGNGAEYFSGATASNGATVTINKAKWTASGTGDVSGEIDDISKYVNGAEVAFKNGQTISLKVSGEWSMKNTNDDGDPGESIDINDYFTNDFSAVDLLESGDIKLQGATFTLSDEDEAVKGTDYTATADKTASKSYDLSTLNDGDRIQINGNNYTYRANESDVQSATDFHTGSQLASMSQAISMGAKTDAEGNGLNDINIKDQFTAGEELSLQVGDTAKDYQKVSVNIQDMSAQGLGLSGLDISTQDKAAKAIDVINTAVNTVSTQRGKLGALQNRLDHTLNNLDATTQNITAAESQIRDVDMAKEMTQYSKNNILVQAAQSMLAQANSLPQGVLSLLQ